MKVIIPVRYATSLPHFSSDGALNDNQIDSHFVGAREFLLHFATLMNAHCSMAHDDIAHIIIYCIDI